MSTCKVYGLTPPRREAAAGSKGLQGSYNGTSRSISPVSILVSDALCYPTSNLPLHNQPLQLAGVVFVEVLAASRRCYFHGRGRLLCFALMFFRG